MFFLSGRLVAGHLRSPDFDVLSLGLQLYKGLLQLLVGNQALKPACLRKLNELLIEGVDELGGTVVTPRDPNRRGALVCIASTDAAALVRELGEEGIVTSSRDGNLRVSPHAYNTPEDVETVLWELARHRELLG